MASFGLLVTHAPFEQQHAFSAYRFACSALSLGHEIKGVFFYQEVEGNKEHRISTESEFSANDIVMYLETEKLYFIRQYKTLCSTLT